MARTARRLLYLDPDVDEALVARAQEVGLSTNEWIHRVIEVGLANSGVISVTRTTTERIEL